MKKLALLFIFLIISCNSFASTAAKSFYGNYPVTVCQPNDHNGACLTSSSGPTILTPNVGIGSSSPSQALDVKGTVSAQAFIATNAAAFNTFAGNVSVGTVSSLDYLTVQSPNGGITINSVPTVQGGIDSFTTLMMQLNNSVVDTSNNAYTLTPSNVTFTNSAPSWPYTSPASGFYGVFNGTNSIVTYPSDVLGTGNINKAMSIDFYIYTPLSAQAVLFLQNSGHRAGDIIIYIRTTGKFSISRWTGTSTNVSSIVNTTGAVTANTWTHVYIGWQTNGNVYFSVNGSLENDTPSGATDGTGDSKIISDFVGGNIAGFRVSDGINRWTSSFTPPSSPYTSSIASPQYTLQANGIQTGAMRTNGNNSNNLELVSGSTNVVDITSAGNVGIGSPNPIQALDVSGTVNAKNFIGGSSGITGGSAGQVAYFSPTLAGTSNIIIQGNNVGIGSVNPGQNLDVKGTIRSIEDSGTNDLIISAVAGNYIGVSEQVSGIEKVYTGLDGTDSSNDYIIRQNGINPVKIINSGAATNSLTIANGNVGIGTSYPLVPLQIGQTVAGSQTATFGLALQAKTTATVASNSGAEIDLTASPAGATTAGYYGLAVTSNLNTAQNGSAVTAIETFPRNTNSGTVSSGTGVQANNCGNTGGGILTNCRGFFSQDLTGGTNNYGFFSGVTNNNVGIGTSSWAFYANGNAPSNFKGSVGIGTDSPQNSSSQLEIENGASASQLTMDLPSHGSTINMGQSRAIFGWNTTNGYIATASKGIGLYSGCNTAACTPSLFITGSNGTVNNSGNVGIGSATPGQALDVQGTIRISNLGSTLSILQGTNSCAGTAALTTGTVTVSTTCTPASANGFIITDLGGGVLANIGSLSIGTVTGGTSFVINSSNTLDSSNVYWEIHKTS